jgi:uncharacterized protein YbjT (DUF2867 family)
MLCDEGSVKVAVLGASGVVGRALVPELAKAHDVIGIGRRRPPPELAVQWAIADVTDPAALERALRGVDVVVHLVHSLGTPDFAAVDRRAASTVASVAERAGLSQIVYLGGLGEADPGLSEHLRSRQETAELLAAGAVPVTTLRAAMVVGAGSAAFQTISALVERLPAMICPRWVSVPTQPIALTDVVAYLVGVCGMPEALGQTYDVGGPEVMTYREMIERVAEIRGKHPLIVEVPFLTPRLSSYWLELVTPVNAAVARPLIDGLRSPTVARDMRIRELVPITLTPFDQAVRKASYAPRSSRIARARKKKIRSSRAETRR